MSEVIIKVIDKSCAWGGGTDCCDPLEGELAGYPEGSTWELPLQWRLQVVEAGVGEMTGIAVSVEEADLMTLTGADRDAAVEALAAGSESPYVIVDGVLACSGSLDIERIADAVRSAQAASTWDMRDIRPWISARRTTPGWEYRGMFLFRK